MLIIKIHNRHFSLKTSNSLQNQSLSSRLNTKGCQSYCKNFRLLREKFLGGRWWNHNHSNSYSSPMNIECYSSTEWNNVFECNFVLFLSYKYKRNHYILKNLPFCATLNLSNWDWSSFWSSSLIVYSLSWKSQVKCMLQFNFLYTVDVYQVLQINPVILLMLLVSYNNRMPFCEHKSKEQN